MRRIHILNVILISIVTVTYSIFPIDPTIYLPTNAYLSIDNSKLNSGDLIFRKGLSFVSRIVLNADERSKFSHVGLVYKYQGQPYVIHAVPDEAEDGIDVVKMDKIEDYLRLDRAVDFAVYRLKNETSKSDKKLIVSTALKYVKEKIPFDGDFDLRTADKLYCTELVWTAYKKAGIDLVDNNFDDLSLPLGNGPYILPGSFIKSEHLKQLNIKSFKLEE